MHMLVYLQVGNLHLNKFSFRIIVLKYFNQVNSQAENWVCDGSLEKVQHNRPDEDEIAVDEILMTPTSNVKGLSNQ